MYGDPFHVAYDGTQKKRFIGVLYVKTKNQIRFKWLFPYNGIGGDLTSTTKWHVFRDLIISYWTDFLPLTSFEKSY